MAFKFVFAFALVAVASAGVASVPEYYHTAPAAEVKHVVPLAYNAHPVLTKSSEPYDEHPQYKFSYGVHDAVSGDSKSQVEERDGDVVRGEYSLIDADGYKRTVQYTADDVHGFQAEVHREPLVNGVVKTGAPVTAYAAPAVVNTQYNAPTLVKTVAPVTAYAAPAVVKAQYNAPALVKTVSPVGHYGVSSAHYSAPITHYSAPITHYSAPITHYSEPITHYSAPVTHYSSPALIKSVSHVQTPTAVKTTHYSHSPAVYTSYSAPTTYVTHH